jgi:2-oxoglutarate dehydrogenase E1 component
MPEKRLLDIARANYPLVEAVYEKYQKDPKSVGEDWIDVFRALELLPQEAERVEPALTPQVMPAVVTGDAASRISMLIDAYRNLGHLAVPVNPIAMEPPAKVSQLQLERFGFSEKDLSYEFPTCGLLPKQKAPLLEIVQVLKKIYCERIGFEYMGIQTPAFEKWIQERIEHQLSLPISIEQKQMILELLNKSELFEVFLHTKFTGQKRFSIEGCETLIPLLAAVFEKGAILGSEEYVLGMAHRGRLNVLANILNKSYTEIFSEFDEGYFPDSFEVSGDVKYHKGFLSEVVTIHGHPVKISLTPNPSHLESVDPVVVGQVKGKQIKRGDSKQSKVVAVLVHGDAAIAGQGVVYETMQFFRLKGYSTGGTIHVVVNNQIGFTTLPSDSRSTFYCTDIAKAFGCPVFHVNAEDPEACLFAAILAAEIRHLYHLDVFIDLNGYRKYGHNEGDEPAFTQPIEYQLIRSKKPIRELYRDKLIQEGVVEKFMAEGLEVEFKKALQEAQRAGKPSEKSPASPPQAPNLFQAIPTGVSKHILQDVAKAYAEIPSDFNIHPKLEQLLRERLSMLFSENKPIDWGMAEILAYGSLLIEGISIRLSGQDTGRGTFSHRHALWMDQVKEQAYFPLSHLKADQGRADVINSPLSEFAALAFEYGYSIAYPEALVIWEAQFGDFSNGAQVVFDQYISCAEQKWGQKSHLTVLLPHGYEGQGPEHSSSRLERFLSLAGNDNMFICNPSTPAQFFHLLRRQVHGGFQKPLICLTPKVLLRHPDCVSSVEDLERGSFQEIIDDPLHPEKAARLIFCTGKIYFELSHFRNKEKISDLSLIRIEQLYPLHEEKLRSVIKQYKQAKSFMWVQEEPSNMGAWSYMHPLLESMLPLKAKLDYIGRPQSASPATGSYAIHKKELAAILNAIKGERKDSRIEVAHFHRA